MLNKAQKSYIEQNSGVKLGQLVKDTGASHDDVVKYCGKLAKSKDVDTKTSTEVKPTQVQNMMDNALIKKERHKGTVIMTEGASQLSDSTKRITRNSKMNRFIHKPKGDNKSK